MDAGQQLVRGGVERRAAVEHVGAQRLVEPRHPGAGDDGEHAGARAGRVAVGGQAGVALGDLRAHVGHVEVRHLAGAGEDRDRRLGVVGVDVDLQRRAIADDEHGVAQLSRAPT